MGKKLRNPNLILISLATALFISGIFILWTASLRIPALEDISLRKVDQSTKIYDRTGEILLYDMSRDVRQAVISLGNVPDYVKSATLAIEDKEFYSHKGFQLSSFLRAVFVNLSTLSFSQGGSTITQQVVKNSILTKDKTPTRKLKELILALKLEKVLTKEEILSLYLNEIPYGGTIYGIEEASRSFFGKSAADLTLAESAYLASLPKAPTYYSPYGPNREELEKRKDLVLREMLASDFISEEEYQTASEEQVEFLPRTNTGNIRAPHFVFFVINQLVNKYGEDVLQNSGFKIITTLDYDIQQEAEEIGLTTWLSGGRVVTNKNTWYAHLFKGKELGRGYFLSLQKTRDCYAYSYNHWVNENKEGFINLKCNDFYRFTNSITKNYTDNAAK